MTIEYAYEMPVGDGRIVGLTVETDGVAADLAGAEFVYVLAATDGGEPVFTKRGTVVSGHVIEFTLDSADTAELLPGEYFHQCKVRDPVNLLPTTVTAINPVTRAKLIAVKLMPSSAKFD